MERIYTLNDKEINVQILLNVCGITIGEFLLENIEASHSLTEAKNRVKYFLLISEYQRNPKKKLSENLVTLLTEEQRESFGKILDEFCEWEEPSGAGTF